MFLLIFMRYICISRQREKEKTFVIVGPLFFPFSFSFLFVPTWPSYLSSFSFLFPCDFPQCPLLVFSLVFSPPALCLPERHFCVQSFFLSFFLFSTQSSFFYLFPLPVFNFLLSCILQRYAYLSKHPCCTCCPVFL